MLGFVRVLPTRLSTGVVEGTPHRTNAIQRQGEGDRHIQNLRLRIVMACEE
jgi:transposase